MTHAEVAIIGAGLAGLSAAVYLGRAKRRTLVIDEGKSMARWEPSVQNYLGFPKGISGRRLVEKGLQQAKRYGVRFYHDRVEDVSNVENRFVLKTRRRTFSCDRLLLATGIFHIPPEIPGVTPCLGHSMFFCKDCDGYRVHGRPIAIYGNGDEAVEYALAMLLYSPCVAIVTDGHEPRWSAQHARWVEEYRLPVHMSQITNIRRRGSRLHGLLFADGSELSVTVLFTTRGDIYYNQLARQLGADLDEEGQVVVDAECRTSVPRLYGAGCVTPANCQMIIAAGHGAAAAQAINRDLFEQSLATHSLQRYRSAQLRRHKTHPRVHRKPPKKTSRPVLASV